MKQVLIRKGRVFAEDVPAPVVSDNTVLVQVYYSCISIGTEMTMIGSSEKTLLKKVIEKPEKVMKGARKLKKEGIFKTIKHIQKIQERSDAPMPAGYSASGIVVEVGSNISDIEVGDRVACAGAGIANHAEYIEVPRNLLVKIPDGVDFDLASTVTLGAIAMQGVRRADARLGENIAVIGLGVLGQITVQLLKANGCRVIGVDLDERRMQKAVELGMDAGVNPVISDILKTVTNFSDGFGVDAAIITAATSSKEPLAQAFQMCRKKGRVVLVGVVGMEINRDDMYMKELDLLVSTSYGPGRYDDKYELHGNDYPYAYVRWTENRNMQEYLRLIADNKIVISPLIEKAYKIEEADKAYEAIKNEDSKPFMVLLKYDQEKKSNIERKYEITAQTIRKEGLINIAIIGAGSFARGVHIPNLSTLKNYYRLYAVMSRTGSNARATAERFGFHYATTDYGQLLEDKNLDAVIITTRHNLHAQEAIRALKAGKAVFVEKPMAVNRYEMEELKTTIDETKRPFMIGFNRRFSKYAQEIKKHVSKRINPLIINYQMNAGYIPFDNWVQTEEGGGRIIGEACHVFDLFNFLTESELDTISVDCITPRNGYFSSKDNIVVNLKYKDGSLCSLTYTALGNNQYPKEFCQIYFDGKNIVLNDYKSLHGYGLKLNPVESKDSDKGQLEELVEFAKYLKGEIQPPIPLWQLIQATETAFTVVENITA
ncbi:MAG: oxidoreductase [Nitrospiraceae bacterium]|nr:MAG: oxidoreductase [Nitrospiraceae bacterium]